MAEETARILIKKGKIASAAFVQGVCRSSSPCAVTEEIFNSVLNPTVPIHDGDLIDWCRWLIAGGQTPEEFFQTVKRYDNATTCGLVWTANFVAYRCRTCGISPCMSLCSECFQLGNHEGHDFNMFRSQAGGACDCGDKGVMKESGFCQRHGAQNASNRQEAPRDLLCVAEVLMPRLLWRLVQHLRVNYESDRLFLAPHMADSFLSLLQTHSEMGAAMRGVMTKALLDQESYFRLAILGDCENKCGLFMYLNSRKYLEGGDPASFAALNESITNQLKESSFLDELIFWVIQYEFPQKLVCLLLNMMPDLAYKEAFTKLFVGQYDRLAVMLSTSEFCELLSNRVVHVSVQLFSNEALAVHMTRHHRLLDTMVSCLITMMGAIAQKSTLQNPEKNIHSVVNCSHHIMKEHCYWPLVSDLNNVFTHAGVAHEFLNDLPLMRSWFKFISLFQGMNVNEREVKVHVEFESNTYYAAFTAELEGCATPMWALISHLKSEDSIEKTKRVLSVCLEYLNIWFSDIIFLPGEEINPLQVSFHLPLHRCFASFLGLAVRQQGISMNSILPPDETLKLMMMHPLQAQVAFHEILCNMWVRNGLQIKGQAMTYIQSHFCNSVVDADLFLLQICAMKLDPDWYLQTVMQRFHVWEWFTFHPTRNNTFLEADKVLPLLEGALSFLCTLVSTRTNIGESEEETIRQEMVSLLCMGDKTHSQLLELLPDKCGEPPMTQIFETVLNEVADYRAPNFEATGAMMQGMYVPKPKVWEDEYNPIHVLLRAVHRRDYQSSLDRYTEYLRQNNKLSGSRPPWPPFRIPAPIFKEFRDLHKLLHCKTMHGIIFTILHRAVYDPDIPEQILSFCIYLLDMAVRFSPPEAHSNKPQEPKEVEDLKFEGWFDSADTLQNVTQEISSIVISEKVVMSMRMVEEMEVDEEAEEVDVQLVEGYYDVHSPEMDNPIVVEEHVLMEPTQSFAELPPSSTPLALPAPSVSSSSSSECTQLVPFAGNGMVVPSTSASSDPPMMSVPPLAITAAMVAAADSTTGDDGGYNMALVPTAEGPTTLRPKCMKLKQVPGRHSLLLSDKGLPLAIGDCESDACTGLQRYHSFSNKRTIYIRESILSLLLRLYSKLSESPDSYKPQPVIAESKSRIGDDLRFLQRLLDRIAASGQDKLAALQRTRERLWPQETDVNMSPPSDRMETLQDRRRRARDRQRKLIAEFASKQKAFMQKTMETEFKEEILVSSLGNPAPEAKKEYECVICSQMSPSEEDRPVGLVVLLQATSVLGHCHENPDRKLPCDDDLQHFNQGMDRITLYANRTRFLTTNFIPLNAPMALNIGWEGGVHVQTCGHYLHVDCHKSYIQSLMNQNQMSSRLQNLSVENGEYFCPLCRQLANSVIPLRPDLKGPSVQLSDRNLPTLVQDVRSLLATPLSESDSNILKKYMGGIMEDLTNATPPQCRSIPSPSPGNLYLFVCSIARTNLELEMVQRKFLYEPSKKSCLVPLLNVLSLHSILLMKTQNEGKEAGYAATMWRGLAETSLDNWTYPSHLPNSKVYQDQVPLLMRDPIALLLQLVLALPLNMDKVIFQCVVQMVYNLAHVQSLASLSQKLNYDQRQRLREEASHIDSEMGFNSKSICSKLRDERTFLGYITIKLMATYPPASKTEVYEEISNSYIEDYVQNYTIHFLKIAALLQSHLYKEEILLKPGDNEFQVMCSFLGLNSQCASSELLSSSLVNWSVDPRLVINIWCKEFKKCVQVTEMEPNPNECLHPFFRCHPPALLRLPHNYDAIFKYYHKKCCTFCHKSPKDPSVCLVCGVMVCLREKCCREQYQYEAVKHSFVCGAGTAIYLAVNSSTIIVIRGKRACLWGSVYLDSYGEEDRDLKRGKPLYLSEDRYRLLQQQWINHSFDHTNKRWVWHKDNL